MPLGFQSRAVPRTPMGLKWIYNPQVLRERVVLASMYRMEWLSPAMRLAGSPALHAARPFAIASNGRRQGGALMVLRAPRDGLAPGATAAPGRTLGRTLHRASQEARWRPFMPASSRAANRATQSGGRGFAAAATP